MGTVSCCFSCNYPLIWTLMSSLLSPALSNSLTRTHMHAVQYVHTASLSSAQTHTHRRTHTQHCSVHHYTHCIALHRQKPEDCVKLFKTLLASLRRTELSQTKQLSLRPTVMDNLTQTKCQVILNFYSDSNPFFSSSIHSIPFCSLLQS